MSQFIPYLDLSKIQVTKPINSRALTRSSRSSSLVRLTPTTLESAFDPVPRQGSSRYRKKLEEMKDGKDYMLLYRLNAEGRLVKVVRRHDFTPVNLEKVKRIHYSSLPWREQGKGGEGTQETRLEPRTEFSRRKSKAAGDSLVIKRVASSLNILAAKRLLNTTLSLEYGPTDHHKTIKPNSSISEFVDYYQHRYERHFPAPAKPLVTISAPVSLPPVERTKSPVVSLKYVKMNRRLGKLLGKIENKREKYEKKESVTALEKVLGRKVSALWKKNSLKQMKSRSLHKGSLSLTDIATEMQDTQAHLPALRLSHIRLKSHITSQLHQLSQQLVPFGSDLVLSPPH